MDPLKPPGRKARLLVVPKKRLPAQGGAAKGHERFYAFVEATEPRDGGEGEEGESGGGETKETEGGGGGSVRGAKALVSQLVANEYETKTRGTRHQGAARLLAEAAYVIGRGGSR